MAVAAGGQATTAPDTDTHTSLHRPDTTFGWPKKFIIPGLRSRVDNVAACPLEAGMPVVAIG